MIAQNATVTVVIPAYNRAATISAAIKSIVRQTYSDFELLIVDDGSSDRTLEEARKISDSRIRIIENPRNIGPAGARNTGIAQARGTWIAFQDSDDEWLPRKLEKQMVKLTERGSDYVGAYCGLLTLSRLEGTSGKRLTLNYVPDPALHPTEGNILVSLLRSNLISTQTLIVRRDLTTQHISFDADTAPIEDWDFALHLAQLGPIAFVDEPLVIQRFSPNSISLDKVRSLRSRSRVIEKHMDIYKRHPDILAWQYFTLAGGHRQNGDLAQARYYLSLARRTAPRNIKILAQSIRVAALGLLPGSPRTQS